MSVEVALPNAAEKVGEGPHWDTETGTLLYVDIMANTVYRWNPDTRLRESIELDKSVGFIVPARNGGFIIGLGNTLVHLTWKTKEIKILHEVEKGTDHRFNDGKCDPHGRVWAGTMAPIPADPRHIRREGSLYCLDLDGKIYKHLSDIAISNGLAWSKDAKTMYFIDTATRHVSAFDYDIDTGNIENRRVAIDFSNASIDEMGFPDGMTIDTNDMLWVACYSGAKVICFDPKTGNQLRSVQFPALRITSCCFGGQSMNDLFVTCIKPNDENELEKYPLSGSIFKVTGLMTKGFPASIYQGELQ